MHRYVGYMYEKRDQQKPEFDAKGIETVRRDVCPAVAKVLGCVNKEPSLNDDWTLLPERSYNCAFC